MSYLCLATRNEFGEREERGGAYTICGVAAGCGDSPLISIPFLLIARSPSLKVPVFVLRKKEK
jgi:hypothetical protein